MNEDTKMSKKAIEKIEEAIDNIGNLEGHSGIMNLVVRNLNQALAILKQPKAQPKELLKACKIGLEKALGISAVATELGAEIIQKHKKHIKQIEAAIAKYGTAPEPSFDIANKPSR